MNAAEVLAGGLLHAVQQTLGVLLHIGVRFVGGVVAQPRPGGHSQRPPHRQHVGIKLADLAGKLVSHPPRSAIVAQCTTAGWLWARARPIVYCTGKVLMGPSASTVQPEGSVRPDHDPDAVRHPKGVGLVQFLGGGTSFAAPL